MNKKIVSLILVVFSMITVVLISVFGKVPEDSSTISVESITIINPEKEDGQCEVNSDGEKVIFLPSGTREYQLHYVLNPLNPTDPSVEFRIDDGKEHATISNTGVITFTKDFTVVVRIFSNPLDYKTDYVIIMFTDQEGEILDPEW